MKTNYIFCFFILILFQIQVQSQPVTYTDNFGGLAVSGDYTLVNGTWSLSSGILQSNATGADPKKLLLTKDGYNLLSSTAQQIVARVRVDSWVGGSGSEDRAGVCLMSTTATDGTHRGYSFLLRPGNTINILSDKLAWATAVSFTWTTGTWYWMKLKIESSTLSGKIWKDGDSEPISWTITKALGGVNWTLATGYPGLVGSAVTGTGVSYDDVTVSTPSAFIPYIENFNSSTICNEWTVKNGTWSVSSGVGQESSTGTNGDPKKLQLTKTGFDIAYTNPQMVLAKVRVDSWSDGDMARAGLSLLNNSSGQGYCLMFHNNHSTLQFLNDGVVWSSATAFSWSNSTWYWFKIQYQNNILYGKVWADGSAEPAEWTITQSGWTTRATGQAALVSASKSASLAGSATVSFDEVMFADPRYIVQYNAGVNNPSTFAASAVSSSQINQTWTKNAANNNVMVAWNSTNTFGTPSGSYSAGAPVTGGGTVLYSGSGTSASHTGLTPSTPYYYKAWSVDGSTQYSNGVTANATTAAAAVIRYVTPTGDGSFDGTSWTNAYSGTQLQTAIDESGITQVWVKAGTYKPTLEQEGTGDRYKSYRMKNNVAIYGGFAGIEVPATFDLDDRNFETNETILSGDLNGNDDYNVTPWTGMDENCYHVFYLTSNIYQSNSTAKLDGFTISGGNANDNGMPHNSGGGFRSYNCYPTLNNLKIVNNIALVSGGGTYIQGNTEPLIITNALIANNRNNSLESGNGGGLLCSNSNVSLKNVTISNNISSKTGGGVCIYYGVTNFNNCIIQGNTATTNGNEFYIYDNTTTTLNYSCYGNESGDILLGTNAVLTATNNNITSDAKFVDAATGDFRLYGNSPCVNTGLNTYNTQPTDIRGQVRIQNTTIDMGAYEFTPGDIYLLWDGSESTDWNTAGNWSGNQIPTEFYNATVPTAPHYPDVSGDESDCYNLIINNGAMVTVKSDGQLTVYNTLTNNAGAGGLVIESGGSLIHNSDGVAATMKREITGSSLLTQKKYHFVSIPTQYASPTSNLFLGSYLYKMDPSQLYSFNHYGSWVSLGTSTTTELQTNQGYMIYYPGASKTYTFTGNLNNGTYTYSLSGHTGAGVYTFNLIPNPYPSAVVWNTGDNTKWQTSLGVGGSCYIWNATNGNYSTVVSGASSYIPAGQAIMVLVTNQASPTLSVSNTARAHSSQAFYKSVTEGENQLVVKATSNNYADETVIAFGEEFTEGFDLQTDGMKLFGMEEAPQLYTLSADKKFSINNLPLFQDQRNVDLNFETKFTGPVSFTISGIESFDPSLNICLKDELTSQTINLRNQQVYNFIHNTGNAASRFKLVFGGTIGIEENGNQSGNIWIAGNTLYISTPKLAGQTGLVEVYNASGQKLMSRTILLDNLSTMELNVKGFVIVKVTTGQAVLSSKGIITK